jgi:hypothetical protein
MNDSKDTYDLRSVIDPINHAVRADTIAIAASKFSLERLDIAVLSRLLLAARNIVQVFWRVARPTFDKRPAPFLTIQL